MYLLDTHTLLWSLYDSEKLSTFVKRVLLDEEEVVYFSVVSLWEIAIKQSLGKLGVPQTIPEIYEECVRQDYRCLNITPEQCELVKQLPNTHGDPFDRLMICQAQEKKLTFLTRDQNISKYEIETYW